MSIAHETRSHFDLGQAGAWGVETDTAHGARFSDACSEAGRQKEGMMIAKQIYTAFDELRQRNTRPRQLIADRLIELADSGADFTVEDLWLELRRVKPGIGRATVYRAVE